jgi:hypothetical protein
MADMKGTLTIFSLSCTLWVTDKPSNLDKPSRRFACDTLWVRPTNPHPHSFTARPRAIIHVQTPLDSLPTLTTHTWFKSMEHKAVVSQARHRNLPQAVRPLRTPLPTVLSRCPLPASL